MTETVVERNKIKMLNNSKRLQTVVRYIHMHTIMLLAKQKHLRLKKHRPIRNSNYPTTLLIASYILQKIDAWLRSCKS